MYVYCGCVVLAACVLFCLWFVCLCLCIVVVFCWLCIVSCFCGDVVWLCVVCCVLRSGSVQCSLALAVEVR